MTSAPITSPAPKRTFVDPLDIVWVAVALSTALATSWLTLRSLQMGGSMVLLVCAVGVYIRSRPAGLTIVWLLWLLTPWLRRVFELEEGYSATDALALVPFLATGVIAAIELYRAELSSAARRIIVLAGAGYVVGLPTGLVAPESAAFAALAYGVAVACFAIGYREPQRMESLTLRRALLIGAPLLSMYALAQYFLPLPAWDEQWLVSVEDTLNTVGSPDGDNIRVFSTLNSPGTFAMMLGVAFVCFITLRRFSPLALLGIALTLSALLLTYARSAWLASIVALVAVVLASRGKATGRLAVVAVLLVGGLAAAGGSGTGSAIVGRADTLGSLGSDMSARERQNAPAQIVPQAAANPLGEGLGQAGEASKLSGASELRNSDNGYLSLIYQLGPLGMALVLTAIGMGVRRAWRNIRLGAEPLDLLCFGLVVFFLVGMLAGDLLYGVTGMAFWYVLGVAVQRNEHREVSA